MPGIAQPNKAGNGMCTVRVDRVICASNLPNGKVPNLPGFGVETDHLLRGQIWFRPYERLRNLKNHKTKTAAGFQYRVIPPWLPPVKATITPGPMQELSRAELDEIFAALDKPYVLQCELAFDFSPASGVDRQFVRAHASFGKSRPMGGNFYANLNYGGRKSVKFIRCYDKPELGCYRVELQFNSAWLRSRSIQQPKHLCKLSAEILGHHFAFVRIDWKRLKAYLNNTKGIRATEIVKQARKRKHVLHRVLNYLRTEADVRNVHRFLKPLNVNQGIKRGLRLWSQRWRCGHALKPR